MQRRKRLGSTKYDNGLVYLSELARLAALFKDATMTTETRNIQGLRPITITHDFLPGDKHVIIFAQGNTKVMCAVTLQLNSVPRFCVMLIRDG